MNSYSNISKDMSAPAAGRHPVLSPLARWHRVFIALVLALALTVGSAGRTSPAQAAPAGGTEIRFSMSARNLYGNAPICVGDNVPIHVRVMRAEVVGDPGNLGYAQYLPGVMVEATTSNTGVGTLNQNTIYTGWNSNDPGGADFKFHADKAGSTTISFKGTINHIWWPAIFGLSPLVDRKDFVNAQVVIGVEDCQYKVTAISHWEFLKVNYEALIVDAALTADAPGHYTGTPTVSWVISIPGSPCPHVYAYTSQADMTGVMDADGQQLVVDLAYRVAELQTQTYDSNCEPSSTSDDFYTPDPLTLTVPSSGGVSTQSQVAVHQMYPALNMTGSAKVSVVPLTKP